MQSTNSQNNAIEEWLRSGNTITPLQALKMFNCFRLGARVWDLKNKRSLPIKTTIIESNGKRFAQYQLNNEAAKV